jgi:hypothetical protein
LVSGNLTGAEIIAAFIWALPKMKRLAIRKPAPFIGKVFQDGSATIWLSKASS